MIFTYNMPIKKIYLENGEFDGYDTKEIIFNVCYEDLIKCYFNYYYGNNYDFNTFKTVIKEFDIDLEEAFREDDCLIERLYYEYYYKNNKGEII